LTHGALLHARSIAEAMAVDAVGTRPNLEQTPWLIVAEAAMMRLAAYLGRVGPHHVVGRACDAALSEHVSLAGAVVRVPTVTAQLDSAEIERLTDPAAYLGSRDAFITRVCQKIHAIILTNGV